MEGKVKVAAVLSNAGYDVWYEQPVISVDGQWTFHMDITIKFDRHRRDICVEIDGKTHDSRRAKAKDKWKDSELRKLGIKVIRLPIMEAIGAPEQILEMLKPKKKKKIKRA